MQVDESTHIRTAQNETRGRSLLLLVEEVLHLLRDFDEKAIIALHSLAPRQVERRLDDTELDLVNRLIRSWVATVRLATSDEVDLLRERTLAETDVDVLTLGLDRDVLRSLDRVGSLR